jgi:hypothetical protein
MEGKMLKAIKLQLVESVYPIDDCTAIRVRHAHGAHHYCLAIDAKYGELHEIALGELHHPSALQADRSFFLKDDEKKVLGAALRMLEKISKRPGDYGIGSGRIAELAEQGKAGHILLLLPVGRKVTKWKAELESEEERILAATVCDEWPLMSAVVLSLVTRPPVSKVVTIRLSEDLLAILRKRYPDDVPISRMVEDAVKKDIAAQAQPDESSPPKARQMGACGEYS